MRLLKRLFFATMMGAPAAQAEMVLSQESALLQEKFLPQVVLDWRSSSSNPTELSNEIEELYLVLYNSGNLNLRTVEIGDPPFVENLLQREGVMHGAHFPVSLDAMLCDMNPSICSRNKVPVRAADLKNPAKHVGGYVPSRGEWRTRTGQSVNIPDYDFTQITTLARITAPKGWTPGDFTPQSGVDCSAWKMSCEEVVELFNPRLLKARPGEMSITVPQLRLETTILLRRDDASEFSRQLEQAVTPSDKMQVPQTFNELAAASPDWTDTLAGQSPTDLTLDAIRDNLRPLGTIEKFGVSDEPMVGEQIDLFKLINHPFGRLVELGDNFARPVDVLIIDSPMSAGHCDLPALKTEDGTDISMPAAAECDTIDQLALSDADHTAAVAGIIASRENGKGIVGINPNARLWMMGHDRNLLADEQIVSLIRRIQSDVPRNVRVANLSFGVRPLIANPRDFFEAMEAQASRLLIVAAAGNDKLELIPDNCPILPACLNQLENVITVVGLNSKLVDPGVWRSQTAGSNSNPKFDIGAPAENVLTTVTGNRFARRMGTSFAAPQVTATASLIFAAGEFIYGDDLEGGQLAPKVVKDRLVYSADFFSGLSGMLYAGRLNVGRAIGVRDAQFELFDGRRIVGQVVEAPDIFVCRTPHEAQQFQRWYDVRRIGWNEAKRRHFLFRHIDGGLGDRLGRLDRDPSCLIGTRSAAVEVLTRQNGVSELIAFQFKDIRDYTSPLFDE